AGALALVMLLVACAAPAQDAPWKTGTDGLAPIPKLTARVTDETSTLSAADRQALEAKLADWEQRSAKKLLGRDRPATNAGPIRSSSSRGAEAWKIGRKG